MNTNSTLRVSENPSKQLVRVNLHSFWIGLAALGCAFLMETMEVNYTYPFEAFLEGVIADNEIIDDHLYKIKL